MTLTHEREIELAEALAVIPSAFADKLHRGFFHLLSILPTSTHGRVLRRYFDGWYFVPDPWRYSVLQYEHEKYAATLRSVPSGNYGRILDAGCGEGLFTRLVAQTYQDAAITGIDISKRAIERAKRQTNSSDTPVRFVAMDILNGQLHEQFDLVFCSDLLYYLGRKERRRLAAQRLRALLAPKGILVLVHPWPESKRLYRHFDADTTLKRVAEHVSQGRPHFAVTIYEAFHRPSGSPGNGGT